MIWGAFEIPLLGPFGPALLLAALLGTTWIVQRRRRSPLVVVSLLCAAIAVPLVAVAGMTLPHTFSNGTVADADEVNQNFESILGDFARYQLSVTGANAGNSVGVPPSVITQLCEDVDGCTVRLLSRDRNFPGDFPFATAPYLLHYVSSGRWSASIGTTPVNQATDGDGVTVHVAQTGSDCYFTDAEYLNSSGNDGAAGLNLLLWNGGASNPNRSCQLTITD
jgi:hypothetical protein